jgi:hypothetical protein
MEAKNNTGKMTVTFTSSHGNHCLLACNSKSKVLNYLLLELAQAALLGLDKFRNYTRKAGNATTSITPVLITQRAWALVFHWWKVEGWVV